MIAVDTGEHPAVAPRARSTDIVVQRALPSMLALLCLVQLAGWAPHYLTWPWWSDHDVFAAAARAWDAGIAPYEGFRLNNFPGTLYLFWILGKVFGWGSTVPLYVFDVGLLVSLGALLVVWSRRVFGSLLPGLVAFALFLSYYLELNYSRTAQRDWHAPVFLVAALLVLQSWRGRGSWIFAGLAAAIGFSIRPQTILLLPAVVLALDHQVRQAGEPPRVTGGPLAILLMAAAAGLAALMLPLVIAGSFDAFLATLTTLAPGAGYSQTSIGNVLRRTILTLSATKFVAMPLAVALLWKESSGALRRVAVVWMAAYLGAVAYGPLSPSPHAYLLHPLVLCWSLLGAVLVATVVEPGRPPATLAIALVVLVMGSGLIVRPRFFDIGRSLRTSGLVQGTTDPARRAPLGYTPDAAPFGAAYTWGDYYATLTYLRGLPSATKIGNALYGIPALVGPSGHLPLFPAESIGLITITGIGRDAEFADAARRQTDAVIVWSPAEHARGRLDGLPLLVAAIQAEYEPDRTFGDISVWRRRPPQ